MTLYDYDLVILGDSPAARTSAELAARYRARVAWVQDLSPKATANANLAWWGFQSLRERLLQHPVSLAATPLARDTANKHLWMAQQQAQKLSLLKSSAGMEDLGVDLVDPISSSAVRFHSERKHPLQLQVGCSSGEASGPWRSLQSRCYLLAPPAIPRIPAIPGLGSVVWDTVQSWLDWPSLPQQVTIVGREPWGIALAQMLARLGCGVTLVSRSPQLLHQPLPKGLVSDASAIDVINPSDSLATLLRVEGVQLVLNVQDLRIQDSRVQDSRIQDSRVQDLGAQDLGIESATDQETDGITVVADAQRWTTDRLVIAAGWQPDWGSLELAPLGLREDLAGKLLVDSQGRTPHRQVYGVGAALGRDGYGTVDQQAAQIATRHVLFGCRRSWAQTVHHSVIWTMPPLVRLGLSWEQVQQRYGDRAQCLTANLQDNLRLQLTDAAAGHLQLVVHCRSGKLLGASLLGKEATEWSGAIALALQQKLTVQQLAQVPASSASFAHLVQQVARQWRWRRLTDRPRTEDLWERFFNWRRTGGI